MKPTNQTSHYRMRWSNYKNGSYNYYCKHTKNPVSREAFDKEVVDYKDRDDVSADDRLLELVEKAISTRLKEIEQEILKIE